MRKLEWIALTALVILAGPFQVYAFEDIYIRTPGFQSHIVVESIANPQQLVVAVFDPAGEPIRDLQPHDFVLARGIRKARIFTIEPLQAGKAPPSTWYWSSTIPSRCRSGRPSSRCSPPWMIF